ncbi:hypothetical protein DXG01_016187 [Tephrocybe rancida]|nr:hypothetical protein DXG01_016187 [Tephrocybe rancida]
MSAYVHSPPVRVPVPAPAREIKKLAQSQSEASRNPIIDYPSSGNSIDLLSIVFRGLITLLVTLDANQLPRDFPTNGRQQITVEFGEPSNPSSIIYDAMLAALSCDRRNAAAACLEILTDTLSPEDQAHLKVRWREKDWLKVLQFPSAYKDVNNKDHGLGGALVCNIVRRYVLSGDTTLLNAVHGVITVSDQRPPILPRNVHRNVIALAFVASHLQYSRNEPIHPSDVRKGRYDLRGLYRWADARSSQLFDEFFAAIDNGPLHHMDGFKDLENSWICPELQIQPGLKNFKKLWTFMTVPIVYNAPSEALELKLMVKQLAQSPDAVFFFSPTANIEISPAYLVPLNFLDNIPAAYQTVDLYRPLEDFPLSESDDSGASDEDAADEDAADEDSSPASSNTSDSGTGESHDSFFRDASEASTWP